MDTSYKTSSKRAVFFDRDGTINVDKHYLHLIEDFEFLPGAVEALRILQDKGFLLVIITNQSGIARGYYKEEDFLNLNEWMIDNLNKQDIKVDKVYYCPHLPDARIEEYRLDCSCRKPKLGMYYQAVKDFKENYNIEIDLDASYAIGDKMRDLAICNVGGCKGYLVGHNDYLQITEMNEGKVKQNRNILDVALEIK